jgi:cytochrome b subunit of formate dehydrogenase
MRLTRRVMNDQDGPHRRFSPQAKLLGLLFYLLVLAILLAAITGLVVLVVCWIRWMLTL